MKVIRLKKHLDFLSFEMKDWDDYANLTWKEYSLDRKKRREVERWVENIVNSSIDISKIILYIKEIVLPESYTKIVASLDLIEAFEPLGNALSPWVKLRNVITHEYLDIKWDLIKTFTRKTKPFYEELLVKTKRFIDAEVRDEIL